MIQITGLKYTSATNTGWIISVTPLVLAVLSFLFLKERIRVNQIMGIIIATIGILLLVSKGDFSKLDWLSSVGDWLVLGSAHTWAIYTVVTRNVARRCHPLALTFAILVPSTVIMLTYMALTSDWQKFTNLPAEPLINLLFLGICGTALGHWFWQEGVARLGAARSGIFLYLEPIATMSLALPYLGEAYSSFTLYGGVLVLTGLFVAERIKTKP
jgi:drug/metabolite transporter (DMT)-like permease